MVELGAIRQRVEFLLMCWADRDDPRYRDPSQPTPRAAVTEAVLVIDQAATMLDRLRSELLAEVLDHDSLSASDTASCRHEFTRSDELTADALCDHGCGTTYVETSH